MKKIKSILIILVMTIATCCIMFTSASAFLGEQNQAVKDDMNSQPEKYISSYGVGMGLQYYVDKTSIEVHQYNPPYYIIAYRGTYCKSPENHIGYCDDEHNHMNRFRYDYSKREMYLEVYDREGQARWEYIDPLVVNNPSTKPGELRWIYEGELAFYLAYNMGFYEKPATKLMEMVLEGTIETYKPR